MTPPKARFLGVLFVMLSTHFVPVYLIAQTIEQFAASRTGKYTAYVVEETGENKEHRQQVWLRIRGEKDRLLLSADQLKKICYAYASTVSDLSWSPSERFLSVGVYDGDVGIDTAVFDLRSNSYVVPRVEEGYKYNSQWHPSKDLLFFQAGDDPSGKDPTIYRYDPTSQRKNKTRVAREVQIVEVEEYQPVMDGLVVRVTLRDPQKLSKYHKELIFVPYSAFK